MLAKASRLGFLDLPKSARESVYSYLLLPHQEDDITTINYRLEWPYLRDPSNTTFAGPTQIDICFCPLGALESGHCDHEELGLEAEHSEPHIYTRYKCHGPEAHFTSPGETLWVLQEALGQFNILRPATTAEIECRPSSAILQVCKQIYGEAHPFLYLGRNFIFLTGPCPRGRYQAYATLQWLKQLGSIARANVESLSLLVQPYEEDCNTEAVKKSYVELGAFICEQLPRFKWLYLEICDESVHFTASVFSQLLERKGVSIVIQRTLRNGEFGVFASKEQFLDSFEVIKE